MLLIQIMRAVDLRDGWKKACDDVQFRFLVLRANHSEPSSICPTPPSQPYCLKCSAVHPGTGSQAAQHFQPQKSPRALPVCSAALGTALSSPLPSMFTHLLDPGHRACFESLPVPSPPRGRANPVLGALEQSLSIPLHMGNTAFIAC